MSNPRIELEKLSKRLMQRIFIADQSYMTLKEIGNHVSPMKEKNFGGLFGCFQQALTDRFLLSLSKLFEAPSNRFEIRSIPVALDKAKELGMEHGISQPHQFLHSFCFYSGQNPQVLANLSQQELLEFAFSYYESNMPDPNSDNFCELSTTLDAVRQQRNKRIAHDEEIANEDIPSATWKQCNDLLDFGKGFVGALGWAFFSSAATVPRGGGYEWLLESDASRYPAAMRRLAKIISGEECETL